MEMDFSDILARSHGLNSSTLGSSRIPRLERQLDQIDRESRRILGTKSGDVEAEGEGAIRLLAEYGFETDKLERTLQSVALLDRLDPYESFDDTNIEAYVRHEHEMLILGAMEENRGRVLRDSKEADTLALESDWELKKRELVLLNRPQVVIEEHKEDDDIATSALSTPFRIAPTTRRTKTTLKRARVDVLYSEIVKKMLQSRTNPAMNQFKVAKEFEKTVFEEKRGAQIEECFRVVKNISGEDSRASMLVEDMRPSHKQTVEGVLRYLNGQFLERKLRATIASAPLVARRGGDPSVQGDVCAFLNVMFERGIPPILENSPVVNGLPLWPQLYYLIRCGLLEGAAELAERSAQKIEGDGCLFHHYIRELVNSGDERRLSDASFGRLSQEYTVQVKRGTDPFRRVCYVFLAQVDSSAQGPFSLLDEDYNLLFNSIEDYLWLRLNQVSLDPGATPKNSQSANKLELSALQKEVQSFGPAHFDADGRRPFLYAHVLLMTTQYEAALEYLAQSSTADLSDSTHLAITMYHYGLIDSGDPPTEEVEPLRLSAFPDLLWRYVKQFSRPYPIDAAMYIFILRDTLLRHSLLRLLMLSTGEYAAILGNPNSLTSSKGALDELWQYCKEPIEAKRSLVASTAEAAENNGDRDAAMLLYNLCGEEDRVTALLVHSLSAQLTGPESEMRHQALAKADEHEKKLMSSPQQGSDPRVVRSFHMILRLHHFFKLKDDKKYSQAWEVVKELNILPTKDDQLIQKSIEWKDGSRDLIEDVTDRIGDVLVAAMECLAEMYSGERRRGREQGGIQARAEIKLYARVLVKFAGILQLPSDVSAKTIRMEVLMS